MNKLSLENNSLSSALQIMSKGNKKIHNFLQELIEKKGIIYFLDFILEADRVGLYGKDIYIFYSKYQKREEKNEF